MDSINKNQPEDNHQDLQGAAAVARVKELVTRRKPVSFAQRARWLVPAARAR
jgi:hypothetical protein